MSLVWDSVGTRTFESGIHKTVLFVADSSQTCGYGTGVAWSGVTSISETMDGGDASPIYADNIKYLDIISNENLKLGIEAYQYPEEFEACDGTATSAGVTMAQQSRKKFCLAYQTLIGNDTEGIEKGYKVHFVYGCLAAPTDRSYQTINDSPDAMSFSWDVSTTPVTEDLMPAGFKPTAIITIDSSKLTQSAAGYLAALCDGGTVGSTTVQGIFSDGKWYSPKQIVQIMGGTAPTNEE